MCHPGGLRYYDENKQLTGAPKSNRIYLSYGSEYDGWLLDGDFLFRIGYSYLYVYYDCGYGQYEGWASLNTASEYGGYYDQKIFVLNGELFALVEQPDSSLTLTYFDLSSVNAPTLYYPYHESGYSPDNDDYDYYYYLDSPAFSRVEEIMTATSERIQNGVLCAIVDTATDRQIFSVTIDADGNVKTASVSETGFDRAVITVQPLN
ncbi:hypothetical protein FACS1894211_09960 [Clostridia bacterium]|nr:hypothetical protein FACS1894211_09960 [Clostridia bacterium]